MLRYIVNENTGVYVHKNSQGQHDGLVTTDIKEAKSFESYGAASDFIQNFGDDWLIA